MMKKSAITVAVFRNTGIDRSVIDLHRTACTTVNGPQQLTPLSLQHGLTDRK